MEKVTRQNVQVIPEMPASPPVVMFLTLCSRKFEILYLELPQGSQQGAHSSIYAAMLQLNNYTKDLLCLFYSPSASLHTQKVYSFTDSELACNILCMCPLKWPDQYQLLEKCYPEDVKPLLLIVEHIEVMQQVNKTNVAAKAA